MMASVLLAAVLDRPEILAVACQPVPGGAVLKILASVALEGVTTERAGLDILISIPAELPEAGLPLPQPLAPLQSLAFEPASFGTRLRVGVEPGTTLETQTRGSMVELTFRAQQDPASRDIEQLYPLLFPEPNKPVTGDPTVEPTAEAAPDSSGQARSWSLGFVSIRPSLIVRYVDAYGTYLDTPVPVRARYLEVQPSLLLNVAPSVSLFGGRLTLGYEPRFRTSPAGIPVLSHPSHYFSAGLELPVGSYLLASLGDQYIKGAVETQVVDPGREYYFDVRPFNRNEASLGLRIDTPGRLDLALGGSIAKEIVEPGGGYFGNERRTGQATLRYELEASRTATLGYTLEHVPPPERRPVVEMRSQSLALGLEGEVATLTRANISVGYNWQRNPRAAAGGDSFRGVSFSASVRRELPRGAMLTLGGSRSTQLSAFESNAFYVAAGLQAGLDIPLPMGFVLVASSSVQRNDYRLKAQQLQEPREDRLWGWGVGIGRALTGWSSLRADYTWDRRRSNVPGLSPKTRSFVVQLGLGAAARGR